MTQALRNIAEKAIFSCFLSWIDIIKPPAPSTLTHKKSEPQHSTQRITIQIISKDRFCIINPRGKRIDPNGVFTLKTQKELFAFDETYQDWINVDEITRSSDFGILMDSSELEKSQWKSLQGIASGLYGTLIDNESMDLGNYVFITFDSSRGIDPGLFPSSIDFELEKEITFIGGLHLSDSIHSWMIGALPTVQVSTKCDVIFIDSKEYKLHSGLLDLNEIKDFQSGRHSLKTPTSEHYYFTCQEPGYPDIKDTGWLWESLKNLPRSTQENESWYLNGCCYKGPARLIEPEKAKEPKEIASTQLKRMNPKLYYVLNRNGMKAVKIRSLYV